MTGPTLKHRTAHGERMMDELPIVKLEQIAAADERVRILKLFRGYADFIELGIDDLPDLQAKFNIGGASHIRKICDEIEGKSQ